MNIFALQTSQFLSFRVGAELFAIDVLRVREVLDVSPITKVPQAAEFMLGLVNVRGSAIPVVDLRARFGLPPAEITVNTRIIVLDLVVDGEATPVGAMADSVQEVVEVEESQIEPPPRIGLRWRSEFLRGLARRDQEFLIILDLDRIFGSAERLLIAAAAPDSAVPSE